MIKIRRMGCNSQQDASFSVNRPQGYDCYLFLLIKSNATIKCNGTHLSVTPGTFILYTPGTPHRYSACEDNYINDWIQFEISSGREFHYTLPLNTPVSLSDYSIIENYLSLINSEFYMQTPSHDALLSDLLQIFLKKLSIHIAEAHSARQAIYTNELLALRQKIYNSPELDWNINSIAQNFSVSPGHFHLLYKSFFHTTCHQDVIQSRLTQAKDYLLSTSKSIQEIADLCGYKNIEHFIRQFKSYQNETPYQFRKNN